MNLDHVTVIIPAHNRPERLNRLLAYYSATNIKVIVSDSSSKKFDCINRYPDVIYKHYPNEEFLWKINHILPLIDTPYVVYCADDDFIVPEAIAQITNYLNLHPDFTTAQGHYLTFEVKKGKVSFSPRYIRHFDKKIEATTGAGRLARYNDIYASNLYSIIRTETFKRMYTAVEKKGNELRFRNLFLAEEYFNLFSLIHGNYITLPCFYSAREYIENSATSTTVPFSVVQHDEKYKEEYANFIDILATELAEKDTISYQEAAHIIHSTIERPRTNSGLSFKRKVIAAINRAAKSKWLENVFMNRYKQKGRRIVKGMSSYPYTGQTPETIRIKACILNGNTTNKKSG